MVWKSTLAFPQWFFWTCFPSNLFCLFFYQPVSNNTEISVNPYLESQSSRRNWTRFSLVHGRLIEQEFRETWEDEGWFLMCVSVLHFVMWPSFIPFKNIYFLIFDASDTPILHSLEISHTLSSVISFHFSLGLERWNWSCCLSNSKFFHFCYLNI